MATQLSLQDVIGNRNIEPSDPYGADRGPTKADFHSGTTMEGGNADWNLHTWRQQIRHWMQSSRNPDRSPLQCCLRTPIQGSTTNGRVGTRYLAHNTVFFQRIPVNYKILLDDCLIVDTPVWPRGKAGWQTGRKQHSNMV